MDDKSFLNLNDFKKWIETQEEKPIKMNVPDLSGLAVESKVSERRLLEEITPEEGTSEELAEEFKHNGGTVVRMESKEFLIEVDSGSFYIHRKFVRRA
jgi:vacuolar-type H+-ATPase subunit E/Vma4